MTHYASRGLEEKFSGYHSRKSPAAHASPAPYRSQSERVVANILESSGIGFAYEAPLPVTVEKNGRTEKRTWHPDFYLSGITGAGDTILEYVGLPDDKEYMKGVWKKAQVYEKMGVNVAWVFPEDIWEEYYPGMYSVKPEAPMQVVEKIYEAIQGPRPTDDHHFRHFSRRRNTHAKTSGRYTQSS